MSIDETLLAALTAQFGCLKLVWRDTGRNRAAADYLRRWAKHVDGDWSVEALGVPPHVQIEVMPREKGIRAGSYSVPVG